MATTRRGEELKWWLIGVLVLAVLVSGTGLLIRQLLAVPDASAPVPPPPSAMPPSPPARSPNINANDPTVVRAAGGPLLPGAGAGDVFVQSATAIYRIELATGRITRTTTPLLEQHSSFVAGPGWVVFKTIDNDPGVVVKNGDRAAPLPPGLQPNGRLYPAPDGDMWLMPENPSNGARVVTRVDVDGRPVKRETIRLPEEFGILGADGTRYLVATNSGGVYQFTPAGVRRLSSGDLIAVGSHHLLVWDCDQHARCNPYRLDRTHNQRTMIPVAHKTILDLYQGDPTQATDYTGDLSPNGTHAALTVQAGPDTWPVTVLDLTTGHTDALPGSHTDTNGNTQLAWTSNSRYLLAITDHRMRAYDTKTRTTRTITVTTDPLLHLTTPQATGN